MEEKVLELKNEKLALVCRFLNLKNSKLSTDDFVDNIKELCVKKVCDIVGIKCEYNYKSKFFNFFSSFAGEAVAQKLNLGVRVAPDSLRLIKYNGINFVTKACELINNEDVDEAFIDLFNLADDNKNVLDEM